MDRCGLGFDTDLATLTLDRPDESRCSFERRPTSEEDGYGGVVLGGEGAFKVDQIRNVRVDCSDDFFRCGENFDVGVKEGEMGCGELNGAKDIGDRVGCFVVDVSVTIAVKAGLIGSSLCPREILIIFPPTLLSKK